MVQVNTHEAKSTLSALLARVERTHEPVTICRNGRPVARLVAIEDAPADPLKGDARLGPVVFHESPTAPLDENAWPEDAR